MTKNPDIGDKQFKEYLETRKKGLKWYQGQPCHPDIAFTHYIIGSGALESNDPENGLKHLRDALKMYQVIYSEAPNHPDIAWIHYIIDNAYLKFKKPEDGLKYLMDARKMYQAIHGKDTNDPEILGCLSDIARAYYDLGKFKKGSSYVQDAVKMYQAIHQDTSHPSPATYLAACPFLGSVEYEDRGDNSDNDW